MTAGRPIVPDFPGAVLLARLHLRRSLGLANELNKVAAVAVGIVAPGSHCQLDSGAGASAPMSLPLSAAASCTLPADLPL